MSPVEHRYGKQVHHPEIEADHRDPQQERGPVLGRATRALGNPDRSREGADVLAQDFLRPLLKLDDLDTREKQLLTSHLRTLDHLRAALDGFADRCAKTPKGYLP